ncbi:MAG: TIGR01906 family membrane protein [Tissierellia bacterium]|nr:TIGR01906 family membrane protein [Tissierellia bacterium]
MRRFILILILIFLPLYLLLKITEQNAFNKNFYVKSYEKNGVVDISNRTLEELDTITEDLFIYIKDKGDEKVLKPYFNDMEIEHMKDVKELFRKGYILKYLSLIISIIALFFSIKNKKWLIEEGVFKGIFIWWGLMALLFLFTLFDFNKYFTYFHLIFFDNDLWLLDPNTDLLIQMLPEEFFISIFRRIVLFFSLSLAIIQIISYIIMKKEEDNSGGFTKF